MEGGATVWVHSSWSTSRRGEEELAEGEGEGRRGGGRGGGQGGGEHKEGLVAMFLEGGGDEVEKREGRGRRSGGGVREGKRVLRGEGGRGELLLLLLLLLMLESLIEDGFHSS